VLFADPFAIRAPGVVAVQEVRLLAPSHGSLGLDENHHTSKRVPLRRGCSATLDRRIGQGLNPAMSQPMDVAPSRERLALDGVFWRRWGRLGARRGPRWFVRWSPPIIGVAVAIAASDTRRRIARELERVRGPVSARRGVIEIASTFANFASCLTEVLATGSKNGQAAEAVIHNNPQVEEVLAARRGLIFATAHTAGWESMGPLLAREYGLRVMVVMQRERDALARELNDSMRQAQHGVRIVHVGDDPLASLPLLHHLRDGGVVALQIDRVPPGISARPVTLFGRSGAIPEGPLRLAQLTGAPIIPVFSARTGHRRYALHVCRPLTLARRADDRALDAAAQRLADDLGEFISAHPTQWFPFHA
jgi:lauroyl/myristoyl acyltransferase